MYIQARSHNCSCLVKAVSITYSVVLYEWERTACLGERCICNLKDKGRWVDGAPGGERWSGNKIPAG